jgi:hypothetical protein
MIDDQMHSVLISLIFHLHSSTRNANRIAQMFLIDKCDNFSG